MTNSGVLVIGELRGTDPAARTLELMAGLRDQLEALGESLTVVLPVGADFGLLGAHGASSIIEVSGSEPLGAEAIVAGVQMALGDDVPRVVAASDTYLGRDVAAQLAAALDAPLVTACERLSIEGDGSLRITRACFGGQLSSPMVVTEGPLVTTVREHAFRASPRDGVAPPDVSRIEPSPDDRIEIVDREAPDPDSLDLAESSVLVSGGLGVGGDQGFALLDRLARLLGGTTSASRAAVDQGWVPKEKQVGQTGRNVAPRLYFACGISGAREHMVGVRDADLLLALNLDGDAPIMREADLAAVGDASEVLPKVLQQLGQSGGHQ